MADIACPICKDKVVNGKCSFCGYTLTSDEIANAKPYEVKVYDNSSNIEKQEDHESYLNKDGHENHEAYLNKDNYENHNDYLNRDNHGNHDAYLNQSRPAPNESSLKAMFIAAIVIGVIFASPMISLIIGIVGMNMSKDTDYYKKFKTIVIVSGLLFASFFVLMLLLTILPFLL